MQRSTVVDRPAASTSRETTWQRRRSASSTTSRASRARPRHSCCKDRLDLVRMADQAGFTGYYLAEHHGSDLCMAPTQEMFIAAASQITDTIRMGPMVKLLPLHHPVRLIEDMCVVDNLTNGRLEFGVGRGVAPIEHYWFGSNWPDSTDRFEDVLGIIHRALRSGEISAEGSKYYDFRTMPMATMPVQQHIPFWYPGSPVTAGRFGLNLMWPGPIDAESYDALRRHVERTQERRGPDRGARRRAPRRLHDAAGDRRHRGRQALEVAERGDEGPDAAHPRRAPVGRRGARRGGRRCRARAAAPDPVAHRRRDPGRCRHPGADPRSLRRDPRRRAAPTTSCSRSRPAT